MDRIINQALGLQMNGFNTEALKIFEKAIKKEPNNLLLCEYYGGSLAESGQFNKAKTFLKKALNNGVEKPQVLNNLATVNRDLGLYEEALLNIKAALKFKPKYIDAWVNCANLHMDLKNWPDAIKSFENAIHLNASDLEPHLNLAHAYLHNLELEKALKFNHHCQGKFRHPQFLVGELICYRAMEKYEKALDFAEKLKQEYDNENMWFEWVQTLWMAKKYEKAYKEAEIAKEKFGEYPALKSLIDLIASV